MNPDDTINLAEKIFLGVFALLYVGVPVLVVWSSYCKKCALDVRDLWLTDGKLDRLAVIVLLTWWVHTATVVLWTLSKTVVTADFTTYMAWGSLAIAKMFAPKEPTA